jgi:hypothetical protein
VPRGTGSAARRIQKRLRRHQVSKSIPCRMRLGATAAALATRAGGIPIGRRTSRVSGTSGCTTRRRAVSVYGLTHRPGSFTPRCPASALRVSVIAASLAERRDTRWHPFVRRARRAPDSFVHYQSEFDIERCPLGHRGGNASKFRIFVQNRTIQQIIRARWRNATLYCQQISFCDFSPML